MKNLIITTVIILSSIATFAQQDTIVKKTREKVPCYIISVDDQKELISYKIIEGENAPALSITYPRVAKIIFRNGQEIKIGNIEAVIEVESFIDLKQNGIKLNMIKPMFNSVEISYERSIKPSVNLQGTVGIVSEAFSRGYIGETRGDERGAYFKLQSKFYKKGDKRNHPLAGAYIAPEIIFSAYGYNQDFYSWNPSTNSSTVRKENVSGTAGAFMINFGKQQVFADVFIVEVFTGIGLDFGSTANGIEARRYSHINAGGVAFDIGLRVGAAF